MNAHNRWWAVVRPALVLFVLFTLLTGVVYPLLVTAVAQTTFPHQANGSLIEHEGMIIGSELIGQPFNDPGYFWARPSATIPTPYNAAASVGSNLAPSNPALAEQVQTRIAALQAADPGNQQPIPVDLVTASGSGLDPHISVAAAMYQVNRVAQARGLAVTEVNKLIEGHTDGRFLSLLGEPRVNVLQLNLALDALQSSGG